MSSLLPALEKKIREICPELQKLEFGCNVLVNLDSGSHKGKWYLKIFAARKYESNPTLWYGYSTTDDLSVNDSAPFEEKDIVEILGKPIELQHVLRAIEVVRKEKGLPRIETMFDTNKGYGWDVLYAYLLVHWNLLLDLAHQTEEIQKWLASILGVESN